ncbi:RagB/SusD family nutrient uptake outer membrane protein [Sphingobacterium humi]|uniref:RagB/SusD family nutrient uptake outer membrane protein n=2 Tax=Sphingobacterium humi TaxID=1796905 RepID=A0A6N8KTB6_9SPHI|nr:RagB/SusD family nutrient uptake outer membrane protein [Sphingobacterium humi]
MLYLAGLGLFMCLNSACSKWLDEHPKAVAAETFYNTPEEAATAVLAPLNKFRPGFAMSFPGLMECFTDYQYGRGSWTSNSDYKGLDPTNITRSNGIWSSLYGAIRDCNIAIQQLPEASAMTDIQKNAYIGELRFLRAFAYFHLVRLWGDVPLRNENNMLEWDLAKTAKADVYKFIIDDLTFAMANAPDKSRLIGTPNKLSSKSLLAQVYMQLAQYPNALPLLKDVIESNQYSLVRVATFREFEKIFGPTVITSSEEIFYFKETGLAGWEYVMFCSHPNAKIEGKKMHGAGGYYGIYTRKDNPVFAAWDDQDLRKSYNTLKQDLGLQFETYIPAKFYDPNAPNAGGASNSFPLIRYADILLLYAEASNEVNGPNQDALDKLNMIHRRAYGLDPAAVAASDYKLADYNSKEKFLNLISKELTYENWNEGKRWLFLLRRNLAKKVIKEVKGIDVMDKHLLFPIPETEFSYNKALDPSKDQNPGY